MPKVDPMTCVLIGHSLFWGCLCGAFAGLSRFTPVLLLAGPGLGILLVAAGVGLAWRNRRRDGSKPETTRVLVAGGISLGVMLLVWMGALAVMYLALRSIR